jgi:hypothetical protein
LGIAEDTPGDDFMVAAGAELHVDGKHDRDDIASTWMHELGHCLGLGHGGADDELGKPNYPSIMNYVFADRVNFNDSFWTLDYCRSNDLPILDEDNLDETAGISSNGLYDHWVAPDGVDVNGVRMAEFVRLDGSATDFGNRNERDGAQDGSFDTGIQQDLNYLDPNAPWEGPDSPSPVPSALVPHNDWARLVYVVIDGSLNPDPRRGKELTTEAVHWLDEFLPSPVCLADYNGDGTLNILDFVAFQGGWQAGEALADCDRNGLYNILDFICFQGAFVNGCP